VRSKLEIALATRPVPASRRITLLWLLTGLSAAVGIATGLFHDIGPPALQATALTLPLLLFALVHGSVQFRCRDLLMFAAICIAVSNAFENLSVLTGFPFGRYHYTESLGPKLFHVPVLIGPVFFAVGYLAWTVAAIILRSEDYPRGHAVFTLPLLASFVLVAWNLSHDPLVSTVRRAWIWHDGGSYFGVPVGNFLGWFLTGYLFFQLFALYLSGRRPQASRDDGRAGGYWLQAVVVYGMIGAIVILSAMTATASGTVTDAAGAVWRIRDIYAVCGIVCTFTMGTFTLLAIVELLPSRTGQPDGCSGQRNG
jgi:putative membrane protein